jgi:hypothetical protein
MVGYSTTAKAWRIYIPSLHRVVESPNVRFDEALFNDSTWDCAVENTHPHVEESFLGIVQPKHAIVVVPTVGPVPPAPDAMSTPPTSPPHETPAVQADPLPPPTASFVPPGADPAAHLPYSMSTLRFLFTPPNLRMKMKARRRTITVSSITSSSILPSRWGPTTAMWIPMTT